MKKAGKALVYPMKSDTDCQSASYAPMLTCEKGVTEFKDPKAVTKIVIKLPKAIKSAKNKK